MKEKLHKSLFFCGATIFVLFSCTKRPFIPDYTNTGGFVIGRETCKADETEDYWLVGLTYYSGTPQYGDTLILNGTTYNSIVKLKTPGEHLKQLEMNVSFDFKTITQNKILTTGCTVANPVIYNLKELFIINQFEIR